MILRNFLGLRISQYYGNFARSNATDLTLGILDADRAIMADFEHSGSLDPRSYAYIQCATLYTTVWGERRVRVINLALQVAQLAGNVFQFADLDTLICRLTREGVQSTFSLLFSITSSFFSYCKHEEAETQYNKRRAYREMFRYPIGI